MDNGIAVRRGAIADGLLGELESGPEGAPLTVKSPELLAGVYGLGLPREEIIILHPAPDVTIESPVSVAGLTGLSGGRLFVTVLDAMGGVLGTGPTSADPTLAGLAYFRAQVPFRPPANSQQGRIQVWMESWRDGAIEHLSSLSVRLQGFDLDPLLDYLEMAFVSRDFAGLRDAMGDQFRIMRDGADERQLSASDAVELLLCRYLTPGQPRLLFTPSPQQVLTICQARGLELIHAVYSSGWGSDGEEAAWLLIGNVNGRARWVGIYL